MGRLWSTQPLNDIVFNLNVSCVFHGIGESISHQGYRCYILKEFVTALIWDANCSDKEFLRECILLNLRG